MPAGVLTAARAAMIVDTCFGPAGVCFTGNIIARVWLPGLPLHALENEVRPWAADGAAQNEALAGKIAAYFRGERVEFGEPVDYGALSPFMVRVLKELRNVGWGRTITYRELAQRAGAPKAARGVGLAMSKNPAPLIIPCHRVVRSDGGLGGFTTPAGVELKRRMLNMESTRRT